MSEHLPIQRWVIRHVAGDAYIDKEPEGSWVTYPDHLAALRACEERVTRTVMHTVDVDSYEEGKRDCKATHPVLALKEITRLAAKGYEAGYEKAVADAQWLLEEHVDSIGWLALTKMTPNDD